MTILNQEMEGFNQDVIPVSKPFIPPLEEVNQILREGWDQALITNNGPLVRELEKRIVEILGVKHAFLTSNGTIALQIAVMASGISPGRVITSPLSYISSITAIRSSGNKVVFSGIDPDSLSLCPEKVKRQISEDTVAILPTHLYGGCCDVEAFERIGEEFGVKIIYDAAHAFGTTFKSSSVLKWGDVNAVSLHAYKVFHAVEAGLVITESDEIADRAWKMRYFGQNNDGDFVLPGLNGKTSELHAAVGLANLKYFDAILEERKKLAHNYDQLLKDLPITRPALDPSCRTNHAYYVIILPDEEILLEVVRALKKLNVQSRRYFYPSLEELPYLDGQMQDVFARDICRRLLALPLYYGLDQFVQEKIVAIISEILRV